MLHFPLKSCSGSDSFHLHDHMHVVLLHAPGDHSGDPISEMQEHIEHQTESLQRHIRLPVRRCPDQRATSLVQGEDTVDSPQVCKH